MADKENLTEVKEGRAVVLYPDSESVFYNPVQKFNRDLSILAIKEFLVMYNKEYRSKHGVNAPIVKRNVEKSGRSVENKGDVVAEETVDKVDNKVTVKESTDVYKGSSGAQDDDKKLARSCTNVSKSISILEGLAATGLRSIRYALEIDGIDKIIANDFSAAAFDNIKRNIEHNSVGNIVEPSLCDAG